MKRLRAIVLLGITLHLAPGVAAAQDKVEQAKTFFNAGAQAYDAGRFTVAIQAFEQAYRLAPRPGILFSIAQAHRRQYAVENSPENARQAVSYYRQYIDKTPQGGRRVEAVQALGELQNVVSISAPAAPAGEPSAAPAKPPTGVMVTTPVKGARISLDGGKPGEAPLMQEAKPGKHTIVVSADGYFDEERIIAVVDGVLTPQDVPLREKPARLAVAAPSGSEISIDGRPVGVSPMPAPVEIPAGHHFVAVTKPGNKAFSTEIDVARGEKKVISTKLETTGQRIVSYVFLGSGAVVTAASVVFAALAIREQKIATDIQTKLETKNITNGEREEYDRAEVRRDGFRRVAGVGFGAGALLAATGFVLFLFDQPSVGLPPARTDSKPKAPGGAKPSMEMSAVPLGAPGFIGAAVDGRF